MLNSPSTPGKAEDQKKLILFKIFLFDNKNSVFFPVNTN